MAYQRTEYHREEDRDQNKGGWRSWFGLDNKDRDEDRGYQYQSTTTYRNPQQTSYYSERPYGQYESNVQYRGDRNYPVTGTGYSGDRSYAGGYSGVRGGYGYQTADECSRPHYGPSERCETYRPTQDRDYYRAETRTYGGVDQPSRPYTAGGDFSSRYGYSGDRDQTTRYGFSGDRDQNRSTGFMTSPDYQNREYSSRYGYSGDRDQSRGYGFSGDYSSSRPYGQDYSRTGYQSQSYSGRY